MDGSKETIASRLSRGGFDVAELGPPLRASRVRNHVPSRGVFRLLLPRVVCLVDDVGATPRASVRPDGIALFMTIVCLGGVALEAFADRAEYPRTYPPEFVLGLSAFYFAALLLEWWTSRRAIDRILAS